MSQTFIVGFITGLISLSSVAHADFSGNAGCLIRSENQVILVKDLWTKKYGLPGGTSDGGESAAETAVRETREETGIEVSARNHLATASNSFHIYDCQPRGSVIQSFGNHKIQVPRDAFNEIEEILLVDPGKISAKDWRFPDQKKLLLEILPSAQSYPTIEEAPKDVSRVVEGELEWIQRLQKIENPFWNGFFGFFSFLGGEAFALLLIPIVCFAINSRKGLELTLLCICSVMLGGLLKKIFGIPRPFYYLPSLQREAASGFGFPSGHTQLVTLVWTWMALQFRFPVRWLVALLIAVLGGLARVYLGVHFFHDVIGGWSVALLMLSIYGLHLKRNGLTYLPLRTWFPVLGILGLLGLIVNPTPEIVSVGSVLLGLAGTLWRNAGDPRFERDLETQMEWRTRVLLLVVVFGGMIGISIFASWLAFSGAFLPNLLIRIGKYFFLGALVGSLEVRQTEPRFGRLTGEDCFSVDLK